MSKSDGSIYNGRELSLEIPSTAAVVQGTMRICTAIMRLLCDTTYYEKNVCGAVALAMKMLNAAKNILCTDKYFVANREFRTNTRTSISHGRVIKILCSNHASISLMIHICAIRKVCGHMSITLTIHAPSY